MTKKKPTIKNVTKELKKFLRERGCLRVFKEFLRSRRVYGYAKVEDLVRDEIEYFDGIDWFVVSCENTSYSKLYLVLEEWYGHCYNTFTNDN